MNFTGIIFGIGIILLIGLLHILIIKVEYHLSYRLWVVFAVFGLLLLFVSTLFNDDVVSIMFGILGALVGFSAYELILQRKRVEKGWFPKKK
ncbi:MAG TPA: DUF4491 family protein [Firmicutes bacterium]|nr:DUF4491 family protein [Bacillota bacterium]